MQYSKVSLREAVKFHGHLGPYLVLGILAGEVAVNKLKCKKHFGLEVKIWGASEKPKSCLIDGLQLSTGATYGKGNIVQLNGPVIKIEIQNVRNKKKITLGFKDNLIQKLNEAKSHRDCEILSKTLFKTDYIEHFNLSLTH